MKLKNIIIALKEQLPMKRFIINFFITGNAWGMFHKNSHISFRSGKPKVTYNTKITAIKSAQKMSEKHNAHFSAYKCVFCDGYHIGKNENNKTNQE